MRPRRRPTIGTGGWAGQGAKQLNNHDHGCGGSDDTEPPGTAPRRPVAGADCSSVLPLSQFVADTSNGGHRIQNGSGPGKSAEKRRSRPAGPTEGAATRAFRRRLFADITDREWNDWRWQTRHRFRSLAQIERASVLSRSERDALVRGGTMLPVGITPYYMSLLDPDDPSSRCGGP